MADINSALHNLQYLQQDAQGALPVIPNNGNPRGAYNMARVPTRGVGAAPVPTPDAPIPMPKPTPEDRYPWLRPSQSMDNVRAILQRRNDKQQESFQRIMNQRLEHRPILPGERGRTF